MLGFARIINYANHWAPYSQFLDLYPETMDDEPRNPYVGDIPEVAFMIDR